MHCDRSAPPNSSLNVALRIGRDFSSPRGAFRRLEISLNIPCPGGCARCRLQRLRTGQCLRVWRAPLVCGQRRVATVVNHRASRSSAESRSRRGHCGYRVGCRTRPTSQSPDALAPDRDTDGLHGSNDPSGPLNDHRHAQTRRHSDPLLVRSAIEQHHQIRQRLELHCRPPFGTFSSSPTTPGGGATRFCI